MLTYNVLGTSALTDVYQNFFREDRLHIFAGKTNAKLLLNNVY